MSAQPCCSAWISGTVTDAGTGLGLASVQVGFFSSSSTGFYAFTDSAGSFTAGVPGAGTYYARTYASAQNYVAEVYNDIPCPSACDVRSGTPIVVAAGETTTGVNFALASGGAITGTVRDAVTLVGIDAVGVSVKTSGGNSAGFTITAGGGTFAVIGLPTGVYFARTLVGGGSGSGYWADELYSELPCHYDSCGSATGTPITVTEGKTTSGVDFTLEQCCASITGTVRDAETLAGIGMVPVNIYSSAGSLVTTKQTGSDGTFTAGGLSAGTYYARTRVWGTQYYFDELYQELPCTPNCTVTTGTGIVVETAATHSGVDFTLAQGAGSIAGIVTNASTLTGLNSVSVQVYTPGGSLIKSSVNLSGGYSAAGLAPGTYYVRTSDSSSSYLDELYDNLPCFPTCAVTTGTAVVVAGGATTGNINFALAPNLLHNSRFDSGTTNWQLYATPDMSYLVSGVVGGVFEYYRTAPPSGTANQAVIFQETHVPLAAQAPLVAQFDLGNSSSVRKRISVLVLDGNFTDLSVCTFWLPPNSPLATYQMRTHTTKAWTNAAIYFYAASTGSNGGYYQLDNVSLQYAPSESAQQTVCVDPLAPTPPGGTASPTLLTNGDFETGQLTPWGTYGQIASQVAGGVFEFYRPAGTPGGVVLQNTAQATTANEILTANFQLGNSSGVRKRVTVLLHDNDFSDLTACTFWLEPGQALSNYAVRSFSTKAWANTTLSVYPATVGPDQWIQLDNATLQRTPAATILGTECGEPGVAPLAPVMDGQVP